MSLNPYLTFNGNCADAFDFYKSVFGGDFLSRSTFAEAPPDMPVSDGDKGKIMHVSLPIGSSVLMGSDIATGFGEAPKSTDGFSICYDPETKEEADKIFAALKHGGVEKMPLQETFWQSYFGMCIDKFGFHWMINMNLSGK